MTTATQLTITGPKDPLVSLTIRKGLIDTIYTFDDFGNELDGVGEGLTLVGVEPVDAILTDAEYQASLVSIIDGLQSSSFTQDLITINALKDSDNATILEFGCDADIADENGLFNFDDNDITKVSVTLSNPEQTDTQDSTGANVSYSGTKLYIQLGEFDVTGLCSVEIRAFTTEFTQGIAICYPGNRKSNLVANIYD